MAIAKNRADWQRTSSVLAMMANVNRDPKKHRPFKPSDMMPPGLVQKTKKQKPERYISPKLLLKMYGIKNTAE